MLELNDTQESVLNIAFRIADEQGFEFDWTSEVAMSKSRSMFRNINALAEEFASQSRK